MDPNDEELQRYVSDFCSKLAVIPFDNTDFALRVAQLQKELKQHPLLSNDANKAWLASKTVIESLQVQHKLLIQKRKAALDQARLTQNRFKTGVIKADQKADYICNVISNKVAVCKPYKYFKIDASRSKTRPTISYWELVIVLYLLNPSPLTMKEMALALNIDVKNKAFVHAIKGMQEAGILERNQSKRGYKYYLHPNLTKAIESP